MANWCNTQIIIKGEKADLTQFYQKLDKWLSGKEKYLISLSAVMGFFLT